MRLCLRLTGLVVVLALLILPVAADQAKDSFAKGQDTEARQDYEAAFAAYFQAYQLKPKDLKYRAATERTRFLAASSLVHRGQLLEEAGKLEEALPQFEKAAAIDPSSFIAQQEIKRTREALKKLQNPPATPAASPTSELKRRVDEAPGPVELKPVSASPISLRMTEDTKVIYTAIGKLAGINVLFDPDYTSRRITIELNSVTLYEALELVALQSKTFWRPVTTNTIFVASDTPAKRKELEQSVLKTFYLSNLSQPTELQDVVNTLRTVLELTRTQTLPTQDAIVVRGTPDQIALAEKVINDIDKARPEVLIEVAVMQVSRDKLRNLGISPPTTASVQLQENVTTTPTTTGGSTTGGTTTTTTGTPGGINLNTLGNLAAKNFLVTIPSATATALFSDSTTKLIQNPQIRALDGQKATLKIGERVPVATGSFQPGIGGVGINPLVNTQFQYLDVGVNIDITPHVHAGHEITLKLSMDVSAVDSTTNIGGIQQPVIGQKKIEHEIRLREGEVNIMGGILEDTQTKALSGYPWISKIPILKYLFSSESVEHRENEIVFVLIPHIVRGQDIDDSNRRAIDVGTANALELRRVTVQAPAAQPPTTQPPSAQPPSGPGPGPQGSQPAMPAPTMATAPAPAPAAMAAQPSPVPNASGTILSFDPVQISAAASNTFAVNLVLNNAQNVYSVPLQITYDPNILQLLNISNGSFLSQDGQPVALVHRDDASTGTIQLSATRPPGAGGISGQGTIFTFTFMAKAAGQSAIAVTQANARDAAMQAIQINTTQAMVTVH